MFWFPLLAVVIWSGNAVVSKMAAGVIEPGAISFYRWFLAWVLVTPFLLPSLRSKWADIRRYLPRFLVLAFFGMMVNQCLGYYAAQTISALNIGIHNALIPLLTVLLSLFMLREKPTMGVVSGSVLSFTGLLWLVSQGNPAILLVQGISFGDLLMFVAVLAYALYGVLLKKWTPMPFTTWQSIYIQMSCGLLWLLPDFLRAQHHGLTAESLPLVLYAAIPASLLATLFWMLGVERMGANKTAIFMNLLPVFTSVIAVTFLGEQLHVYHLFGGGLTLIGVILCQCWKRPLRRHNMTRDQIGAVDLAASSR